MERFIQYLDEMDDLFYTIALAWERIRKLCNLVIFLVASLALQVLCIYMALATPPLALATASVLMVFLLYRSVVLYGPRHRVAA